MSELTPRHVLVDLFGGADFDHEILDPERAADIVIERLADAGFKIVSAGEKILNFPGAGKSRRDQPGRQRSHVRRPDSFLASADLLEEGDFELENADLSLGEITMV
jgi:hypothetical protein